MKAELNLDQFRTAFHTGGLSSISLTASGGQFFITAQPLTGKRVTLATTHRQKRRAFRNPAKAIEILHAMGARKVEIDTSRWSPEKAGTAGRKRPDTSERQRRAHQAAAHDAWFRQEVEQAVREADSPQTEWESQAEVKRQSARRRAVWLGQAKAAPARSKSAAVKKAAV